MYPLKIMSTFNYPREMELFPPGGFSTRDDGRSVKTFPQFIFVPFAKALFETCFAESESIKK